LRTSILRSQAHMLHLTEAKNALERPNSPGEEAHGPPQAPASPSHSWSSTSTEPLPLQSDSLGDAASPSAENRPKRCKISHEQLSVLIKSFDEEPLPNFDQRQSLAKLLGMTPRSVQIWFQNRRQRLKPVVQKLSGGEEIDAPLSRRSHGLGNGMHASQPGLAPQQAGSQSVQLSRAEFGMPGLAAAAASLCSSFPPEPRMMPHLQHLHQSSGNLKGLGLGYDVMEPFAATKALLGAGYHPPSALSLISRMGARHISGTSPVAGCSSAALSSHASDASSVSFTSAPPAPPPAILGLGAAATHSHAAMQHHSVPMPSDMHLNHAPAPADGLLLLLECADGPSSRSAPLAQSEMPR